MADTGDDATQGDAEITFSLIGGVADGMQILTPRANIPAAAEIWRQKGLAIDHTMRGTFLQNRQCQAAEVFGAL